MLRKTLTSCKPATPLFERGTGNKARTATVAGSMRGGVPRIYYEWMRPGSETRRRFEKMRNPFVDLNAGTSIYYRDTRESAEAMRREADAAGLKGMDNAVDLYNEHRVVPDMYPEGFQWKHKLNTEYNQWRSNTWVTPDLIPQEHRGRLMANFHVNVVHFNMRVAKFEPFVTRQWFQCTLYVGTGKGLAGYGNAVAPSTGEAKKEAVKNAFQNLAAANLEDEGPVYPLRLHYEGVRLTFYPADKIAAPYLASDVLCAFGFIKAGVRYNERSHQRPTNLSSKTIALFMAVERMRSSTEMAHSRGKIPASLVSNAFPFMEEVRRRKGMLAMHPAGKDGVSNLTPNRVVDNRLPDHLKKTYYDDKYWKDFFAGAKGRLNDPQIGMRPDELRKLVPPTNERMSLPLLTATRSGSGKRRRTLADVLSRLGRNQETLGALRVVNPYADAKVASSAKSLFHLH